MPYQLCPPLPYPTSCFEITPQRMGIKTVEALWLCLNFCCCLSISTEITLLTFYSISLLSEWYNIARCYLWGLCCYKTIRRLLDLALFSLSLSFFKNYHKLVPGHYCFCSHSRDRIESVHVEKGISYRRSHFPPMTAVITFTSDDLQTPFSGEATEEHK